MSGDYSKGKVWKNIISQAIPLTIAQLVHLLYNIVDRIYIGHMADGDSLPLTGVGLTFPLITLIMAFTALLGNGGVPLFSIARGAEDEERAKRIMGNSFFLLLVCSVVLTAVCYTFRRPVLFLFGASEASYAYAEEYLLIYLAGTVFAMVTTGMNGYISAQGFPRVGMLTTVLGAVANILLDPIFIFALDMGVAGAALATVISQALSALWVVRFLFRKTTPVRLTRSTVRLDPALTRETLKMGTAGFIMQGSNCLVQVACNSTLQIWGGDLYVGIMTVLNSVREILSLPVLGITSGAQPVLGYNYGAKRYGRVLEGIRFNTLIGSLYTVLAWLSIIAFPRFWFSIFSTDPDVISHGPDALKIYFFGFVFMTFQFAGQSVFQALGRAKNAIFFSLLRKVIIVTPLVLLLPRLGLGVAGVFWAEPVSNLLGGVACFVTMWRVVYLPLKKLAQAEEGKSDT